MTRAEDRARNRERWAAAYAKRAAARTPYRRGSTTRDAWADFEAVEAANETERDTRA